MQGQLFHLVEQLITILEDGILKIKVKNNHSNNNK